MIKIGLIGAGGIAQAYSAAIKELSGGSLVAVADNRRDAAEKMAAEHDAKVFGSYGEFRTSAEVDAVIVCTPPAFHPEHTIEFLKNGTHVLCEKPLAIDSVSAMEMTQAANTGNAVFTMASKFRFMSDIAIAKQVIDEGKLGDIVLYENCFTGVVDMSSRWNSDPSLSGGGVLIDNGTHSLDIMRSFLGDLTEIRAVEGMRIQELPVEDTVHVFVRSASGAMGCIDCLVTSQRPSLLCQHLREQGNARNWLERFAAQA